MEGIRKISNDSMSLKELQKRLNNATVELKYNFIIEEEKNTKTSLKYNIKMCEKNHNTCVCVKCFFDKVDILYYVKGLEDMEVLRNERNYKN